MPQFGRPRRMNKGIIIKFPSLASTLLPDEQLLILSYYLFDFVPNQRQGFIPRDFSPFSRLSLSISPQQGRLNAVGVIDRHYLGLTLDA